MTAAPFVHRRMVEFADTDMAGIMHFSAFFRFMESAEHALVRSLGLSIFGLPDPDGGDALVSFPRVNASCDFHSPARCEDELAIEVAVKRLGKSSVTYAFRFRSGDHELAEGEMTSVCCRLQSGQKPEPLPIPAEIVALLKKHQL